jgi:adenosylcobinamide kinase / adenosylcobinamide-phosphate guanylyltransferase
MIILVTGATRSGKSEWAETLATEFNKSHGQAVIYIATSRRDSTDREWMQRIQLHSDRRPQTWQTLEVPIDLAASVRSADSDSCLLVDSLGTWVANLLDVSDREWNMILNEFLISLKTTLANTILVGEETGWGVVPAYPTGRLFRDRLGTLVRQVGGIANPVYLVAGGHILNLSILGTPLDSLKDLSIDLAKTSEL